MSANVWRAFSSLQLCVNTSIGDPVPRLGREGFTKLRAQALKLKPSWESFACISKDELPALLRVMNAYPASSFALALRLNDADAGPDNRDPRRAPRVEFHNLDGRTNRSGAFLQNG